MRKLLSKSQAVAGLSIDNIEEDTRLYEFSGGDFYLNLVEPSGKHRLETQAFIAQGYRRVFGARLHSFYPSLIALNGPDEQLCGAVAARYAEDQALFIEQYLDHPVECEIARMATGPVSRASIVEIGSLCVLRPSMTYPFISMIGSWLQAYGVEWLVFSLTKTLRRLFQRADVDMVELGPADAGRLASSENDWGSYYDHDPRVMAARLDRGLVNFHHHHPGLLQLGAEKTMRYQCACRA